MRRKTVESNDRASRCFEPCRRSAEKLGFVAGPQGHKVLEHWNHCSMTCSRSPITTMVRLPSFNISQCQAATFLYPSFLRIGRQQDSEKPALDSPWQSTFGLHQLGISPALRTANEDHHVISRRRPREALAFLAGICPTSQRKLLKRLCSSATMRIAKKLHRFSDHLFSHSPCIANISSCREIDKVTSETCQGESERHVLLTLMFVEMPPLPGTSAFVESGPVITWDRRIGVCSPMPWGGVYQCGGSASDADRVTCMIANLGTSIT